MSIVSCPGCGKRVSSVAALCPHCGFARDAASAEQVLEMRRRKARDSVYRLKMASYAGITLFLGAFAWYWQATAGLQQPSTPGPFRLMCVSALFYLLLRILLYRARSRHRELQRAGSA